MMIKKVKLGSIRLVISIIILCLFVEKKFCTGKASVNGKITKFVKNYIPLGVKNRKEPVNPWAFIRVKEEIRTVKAALESIAPAFEKGVIGYLESKDGTEEAILEFVKKHPGFIAYKYEHEVLPPNHPYYFIKNYSKENLLSSYYNSVFSKIPVGEWFMKIDSDHIYDASKLKQLWYLPYDDDTIIYFSRIYLFKTETEILANPHPFYYTAADNWLLKKKPSLEFLMYVDNKTKTAWEYLNIPETNLYQTDLLTWHYNMQKSRRCPKPGSFYNFTEYSQKFNMLELHITPDMFDYDRIWRMSEGIMPAHYC